MAYYAQSIRGQLDIWNRERPIDNVLGDASVSPALREKLARVVSIREFASRELGLPDNQSYRLYADLERPYVVWNVFAAEEFSTQPKQWCFAIAGCVNYRGYFSKTDADAFAAQLLQSGHDVYVGGVPAYSTLGWFADPVLNTFVHYPPPEIARLVFHELSHQVVYVADDSVFNESFAVTVERAGLAQWLARHGNDKDRAVFEAMQHRRADFVRLIQTYRQRLNALYGSGKPADAMRAAKKQLFGEMFVDYQQLKVGWGGYTGYDRWFAQPPNNALLASVAIYTQRVPAFEAMLREQGGDLKKFFAAVKQLARLDKTARDAMLAAKLPHGSSAVKAAGAL